MAHYDIRPDQDQRPGITKATAKRGWGTLLLVVSSIVFVLSIALGTFGAAPLFILAVLMVPLMLWGGSLMRRGRSKQGPARPEMGALHREQDQVRLRDDEAKA